MRTLPLTLALTAVVACVPAEAQSTTIIATSGGTRYSLPIPGGPATSAAVGTVSGVTADRSGNVFFSDISTDRVYKVDTRGQILIYAGSGVQGYSGDGGPATEAALYNPRGLAIDGFGNLYICDTSSYRIRKVTTQGVISTVAGAGSAGFAGDGGLATSALIGSNTRIAFDSVYNLYISDPDNHRVRRVTADGIIRTYAGDGNSGSAGDGGPATQASLSTPLGLAFDSIGNLLIADSGNNRVRRVNSDGSITTIAGTGTGNDTGDGGLATAAHLGSPAGIARDKTGALFIADQNTNRIRRIDPLSGVISTVAGTGQAGIQGDGGPAVSASLYGPLDLFFTPSGALLVADSSNFRVRSLNAGLLTTVAGNGNYRYSGDGGIATNATFPSPDGLAVDAAGNINICDNYANRVRTINRYGIVSLTAGTGAPGYGGDGGPATSALLIDCDGIALDTAGNLYLADTHNNRIRKINTSGIITTFAGNGTAGFSGDGGQATGAELNLPQGVAVDSKGNVYIADSNNNRIRKVTPSGVIGTIAGDGSEGSAGNGDPALAAQLNNPSRIAVDGSGNIYFSDNGNHLVRRISATGIITTIAGTGNKGFSGDGGPATSANLNSPAGLAIDASGGILIADTNNLRIRRVDPVSGAIATIAGNGGTTLSGDGRAPTLTGFGSPVDVAVDSAGNIYTADQSDGRIRRIQPAPASLVISESGLTFTAAVDGGAVTNATLSVLNGGAGTIGWSVVSSVTSGANWLSASPAQGASTINSSTSPVSVSVNPAGLAAGNYYGQLQIASPGVANSPRFVTVVLRVLSASQTTGPSVSPAGFLFTGAPGTVNPAPQTLTLSELHGAALQYTASVSFADTNRWLTVTPAAGAVSPSSSARLTLQPSVSGLTARVYTADIHLTFSDGSVRDVPATLTVSSAPAGTGSDRRGPHPDATCSPTQLLPAPTSIPQNFSLPTGWPMPIEVNVVDDCGQPFTGGTVIASFSDGDPVLPLASLQNGSWAGTWSPRSASNVTITITAQGTPPASLKGSIQIGGHLNANTEPPILATGGILDAASFSTSEPVATGALVAIFGAGLAGGTAAATALPLPTELAGTQVIVGGLTMPLLYVSPTQINAMVPFSIASNTTQQVIVQNGLTLSVPEPTVVSPGAPAAFTRNGSGSGAAIVAAINPDGSAYIVTTAQPAHPGAAIVIYCTGLGGVESTIRAGQAAPITPLSPVSDDVTLSIGGVNAQVLYAGLVPTFSGLYQVNAQLPSSIPTGDSVPVTLTTLGVTSPAVTISIH